MAVSVAKELRDALGAAESCILCHRVTRTWWGSGCTPLCEHCAQNVSHGLMVKISRREHLGPLPSASTEIPLAPSR